MEKKPKYHTYFSIEFGKNHYLLEHTKYGIEYFLSKDGTEMHRTKTFPL